MVKKKQNRGAVCGEKEKGRERAGGWERGGGQDCCTGVCRRDMVAIQQAAHARNPPAFNIPTCTGEKCVCARVRAAAHLGGDGFQCERRRHLSHLLVAIVIPHLALPPVLLRDRPLLSRIPAAGALSAFPPVCHKLTSTRARPLRRRGALGWGARALTLRTRCSDGCRSCCYQHTTARGGQ